MKKDNAVVFSADALAVKDASQTYSFVVVGDLGAGSIGQKRIAQAVYKAKPDFVVMPGDLTYNFGRLSEYFTRFFPVYNSDSAASDAGVPLMRSTLCMPVLGNHDIAVTGSNTPTDLNTYPDALAYFLVWSSPLNGPLGETHTANRPMITGDVQRLSAFRAAAESRYPRMANYSFDYANSHWLVLDANYYMDWSDKTLRKWVETDLNNAKGAKWRFVTFHQPSFSADEAHFKEQRMRVLCNLFESKGVDIVFAGHAHNYQRTYPLRFRVRDTSRMIADGTVSGDIALDHSFDDSAKTKPKGIIYIVTGAGGAKLYKPVSTDKMNWLGNFIKKLNADVHSYTMCKVNGATLSLQQISDRGEVLDQFTLSKD
ncbi:MAG TPA: metallophosphoesterase [Candidatus Obscuribacterales bacterium]